ncbi:uncharacterized protein LOC143183698 [Calliopsis andreniformis]|uniref:uncharacterized protein LOC143183698 n=1 Tax=Calliopsis andreniformis TaxID=337506 RepID=UPI003FCEE162
MGKTPKKAAPGGDERNLYNRRPLKATAAASKASETNLHKRQRESESSNRSKLSTSSVQKNIPPGQRKNFKSKPCVPAKFELDHTKKSVGRSVGSGIKKLAIADKAVELKPTNMQPESEEAEVKANVSKQDENDKDVSKDEQQPIKECVDHAPPESSSNEEKDSMDKNMIIEQEQTKEQETPNDSIESKEADEQEDNDLNLSLQVEDSPTKPQEEKQSCENSKDESKEETVQTKDNASEKEDLHSASQTDTESYSVDALESTTSEVSEVSETLSQNDPMKEKTKPEETVNKADTSCVSYDPAITLKDVQIKLNDCMKDNSKLFDASTSEQSTLIQPPKDMSFGKTLRSITGRRSLSRMRHVTLREQRYSPNNSMFVNTSSASLQPDDTEDFKILRYSTGLSDMVSTSNGSPTERKRKHETEEWSSSMKKQKTESENSLLNTSISLLKGLRRPIQISTPVSELKFQTGKLDLGDEESNKSANEGTKKWCAIM